MTKPKIVLPIILACPTRPIEVPRPKDVQQTNKYFPQSLETGAAWTKQLFTDSQIPI